MTIGLITEVSVWLNGETGFAVTSLVLVVDVVIADSYRHIDKQLQPFAIVEKQFGHNVGTWFYHIDAVILLGYACRYVLILHGNRAVDTIHHIRDATGIEREGIVCIKLAYMDVLLQCRKREPCILICVGNGRRIVGHAPIAEIPMCSDAVGDFKGVIVKVLGYIGIDEAMLAVESSRNGQGLFQIEFTAVYLVIQVAVQVVHLALGAVLFKNGQCTVSCDEIVRAFGRVSPFLIKKIVDVVSQQVVFIYLVQLIDR